MVRGESSTPGGRSGRARRTLDAMSTPSATRDEIDRFATGIGEWLLTQEFGVIKPLASATAAAAPARGAGADELAGAGRRAHVAP